MNAYMAFARSAESLSNTGSPWNSAGTPLILEANNAAKRVAL